MIEAEHRELSIRSQCQLLAVNRASFYYKPRVPSDAMSLANEIHEIWMGMPFYGYRRIGEELRRRGHAINEKRTLRLMREMGLQALYPRPRTTVRCREHKVCPYLLKDCSMSRPGQVGATDITYIKMPQGFGYLVPLPCGVAPVEHAGNAFLSRDVGGSLIPRHSRNPEHGSGVPVHEHRLGRTRSSSRHQGEHGWSRALGR